MRPLLHPRLINNPYDDPGLYIQFLFEARAFIFDLGDIHLLSPRDILKISHAFVTHTHMDHFIGFDYLLRLALGRNKILHLYGPAGFHEHVVGKLAGYRWNLVNNYTDALVLDVNEVRTDYMLNQTYRCQDGFRATAAPCQIPFNGNLWEEPGFHVSAAILDHQIPCLGLRLEEQLHINIKKDTLIEMGIHPGPWLQAFKQALYEERDLNSEFMVPQEACASGPKTFNLGWLSEKIALRHPGQKISYITDVASTPSNDAAMIELARNSDHLYIEAAFLQADKEIAARKHHLTAWQAGKIAAQAQVKRFTPFHFSPRYTDQGEQLYREANAAFERYRNR